LVALQFLAKWPGSKGQRSRSNIAKKAGASTAAPHRVLDIYYKAIITDVRKTLTLKTETIRFISETEIFSRHSKFQTLWNHSLRPPVTIAEQRIRLCGKGTIHKCLQ